MTWSPTTPGVYCGKRRPGCGAAQFRDPSRPLLSSHVRCEQGHLMADVCRLSWIAPGQAPVVGVIAPQLKKHHQAAERNRRSGGKEKELTERKKNNKPDRESTILKEEKAEC